MAVKEIKADTVAAKRFQLVGDDGQLRALMKTVSDNPILEFMDDSSRFGAMFKSPTIGQC